MSTDELGEQHAEEIGELPAHSLRDGLTELYAVSAGSFHVTFHFARVAAKTGPFATDLKSGLLGVGCEWAFAASLGWTEGFEAFVGIWMMLAGRGVGLSGVGGDC